MDKNQLSFEVKKVIDTLGRSEIASYIDQSLKVHGNKLPYGWIGTAYSEGLKIFSGNICAGTWYSQASNYKFPGKSNHEPPPGWNGNFPPGWDIY